MTEFRLTQISDTHLSPDRLQDLTDNFHRVSEHIDATRPDLVVNSGDVGVRRSDQPRDLEFAKELHDGAAGALPLLPGNHDIGDNPTAVGAAPCTSANEKDAPDFIELYRRRPLAIRSSRLALYRAELADHEHGNSRARPSSSTGCVRALRRERQADRAVSAQAAISDAPDDPEEAGSAIRYVPQPRRSGLIEMFRRASMCGWSRAATSISAATSPLATPATSGRRPPASSFPTGCSQ